MGGNPFQRVPPKIISLYVSVHYMLAPARQMGLDLTIQIPGEYNQLKPGRMP